MVVRGFVGLLLVLACASPAVVARPVAQDIFTMMSQQYGGGLPQYGGGLPQYGGGLPQYGGGYGGYGGYGYGSGFGYGYGGVFPYGAMPGMPQQQPAQQAAPQNYMWLCLEDIFPADVRAQAGVPNDVGEILSSYVTHAYVLVGTSPTEATGWQLSLDEGMEFWGKVLMDAKNMDRADPIEWGKKKAATIEGRTKISTAPGAYVYSHSQKCFRTNEPVTCSNAQIRDFSNSYFQQHPRFNLASNNCVMYACNVMSHCSASTSSCNVDQCVEKLMYHPMGEKNPQCSTQSVLDRTAKAPAMGLASLAGVPVANNAVPVVGGEGEAGLMGGKGKVVTAVRAELEEVPSDVREFLPMHGKAALELVAKLRAKEEEDAKSAAQQLAS